MVRRLSICLWNTATHRSLHRNLRMSSSSLKVSVSRGSLGGRRQTPWGPGWGSPEVRNREETGPGSCVERGTLATRLPRKGPHCGSCPPLTSRPGPGPRGSPCPPGPTGWSSVPRRPGKGGSGALGHLQLGASRCGSRGGLVCPCWCGETRPGIEGFLSALRPLSLTPGNTGVLPRLGLTRCLSSQLPSLTVRTFSVRP